MTIGAGSTVFIDTNIAVYAMVARSWFHPLARRRLDQLEAEGARFCLSRQVLREFLAVVTRPGFLSPPLPLAEALRGVATLAQLPILEEDAEVTRLLCEMLQDPGAKGRQVHDANMVATLRRHGIEYLLTHDTADSDRYRRWITVLPLEAP